MRKVRMVFAINGTKSLTSIISDKFILNERKPKVRMNLRVCGCVTRT